MAAPLMMNMGSTQERPMRRDSNEKRPFMEEDPNGEASRPRNRKCGKPSTSASKKPQRGMGVAQLERLRLEERWRKLAETHPQLLHQQNLANFHPQYNPYPNPHPHPHPGHPHPHFQNPNLNPNQTLNLYDPASYNLYQQPDSNMLDFNMSHPNLMAQRFGQKGQNGFYVHGPPMTREQNFGSNVYRVGMNPERGQMNMGNVYESSKELASVQSTRPPYASEPHDHDPPCRWYKTTKNDGEISGFNGAMADGRDFLELNLGNSSSFTKAASQSQNDDEDDVEVLGVHRNGNNPNGKKGFMEYEFFPRKGNATGGNLLQDFNFKGGVSTGNGVLGNGFLVNGNPQAGETSNANGIFANTFPANGNIQAGNASNGFGTFGNGSLAIGTAQAGEASAGNGIFCNGFVANGNTQDAAAAAAAASSKPIDLSLKLAI